MFKLVHVLRLFVILLCLHSSPMAADGTLTGTILFRNSKTTAWKPDAGAEVWLLRHKGDTLYTFVDLVKFSHQTGVYHTETNALGEYEFPNLPSGTYDVIVVSNTKRRIANELYGISRHLSIEDSLLKLTAEEEVVFVDSLDSATDLTDILSTLDEKDVDGSVDQLTVYLRASEARSAYLKFLEFKNEVLRRFEKEQVVAANLYLIGLEYQFDVRSSVEVNPGGPKKINFEFEEKY